MSNFIFPEDFLHDLLTYDYIIVAINRYNLYSITFKRCEFLLKVYDISRVAILFRLHNKNRSMNAIDLYRNSQVLDIPFWCFFN